MKIGYLCSDSDVQVLGHQGCSVHIREFTDALVEAGHDVFIICSWLGDPQIVHPKARIYQLDPTGKNKALWQGLYDDPVVQNNFLDRDLRSAFWNTWLQSDGAAIMAQEKPKFIYERYALFGFGGLEISRRLQIPLILELNAPLCDQQEGYQKFPLIHAARQLEPQIIAGVFFWILTLFWFFIGPTLFSIRDNPVRLGALPGVPFTLFIISQYPWVLASLAILIFMYIQNQREKARGSTWSSGRRSGSSGGYSSGSSSSSSSSSGSSYSGGGGSFGGGGSSGSW
jgi:hypothetical protein